MPCHAAMIEKVKCAKPDQTVEDVLALMEKKKSEVIPVVDKDEKLVGIFSYQTLMKNILPVSISLEDGFDTQEIVVGAAPGIAKRLRNAQILKVSEFMDRKFHVITPEMPLWKAVALIVEFGGPLYVVDQKTQRFAGVVTGQSAMDELKRLQDS